MKFEDSSIEQVTAELTANGFVIIEGVLGPKNIRQKRKELTELLAAVQPGTNSFLGFDTRRVFALLAKVRCFDDAVLHPTILGVMDEVLEHYQLCVSTGIEIGPGESAQTLHADDGVYPLPTSMGPLTVNSMWAIDDFTETNGATRVIAQSHRRSEKRAESHAQVVVATMPAGSVLIYLGSLLHGGGSNTTDRPRLGVVLEYAVSWLRPQENLGLTYPPDLVRPLPKRLQELLGYNLYPPLLGYVDGRHPEELLR